MTEYKKCPYCGEEVLAEAKKCRHCREWLIDQPTKLSDENEETPNLQKEGSENHKETKFAPQSVVNNQPPIVNVYTTAPRVKEQKAKNGIGLTGFILSIVCLATSWAPGLNIVMWILGLVFSAVGVFKKPKGFAIAGLAISVISLLVIIVLAAAIGELASELLDEFGL